MQKSGFSLFTMILLMCLTSTRVCAKEVLPTPIDEYSDFLLIDTTPVGPSIESDGRVKVGDDNSQPQAGVIRYRDGKFQGHDGFRWKDFNVTESDTFIHTLSFTDMHPTKDEPYIMSGATGIYSLETLSRFRGTLRLPQGARIVEATAYILDRADQEMVVLISRNPLDGTSYANIAELDYSGTPSPDNNTFVGLPMTLQGLAASPVDNSSLYYSVSAYADSWTANLRFKAVVIRYVIED